MRGFAVACGFVVEIWREEFERLVPGD